MNDTDFYIILFVLGYTIVGYGIAFSLKVIDRNEWKKLEDDFSPWFVVIVYIICWPLLVPCFIRDLWTVVKEIKKRG